MSAGTARAKAIHSTMRTVGLVRPRCEDCQTSLTREAVRDVGDKLDASHSSLAVELVDAVSERDAKHDCGRDTSEPTNDAEPCHRPDHNRLVEDVANGLRHEREGRESAEQKEHVEEDEREKHPIG